MSVFTVGVGKTGPLAPLFADRLTVQNRIMNAGNWRKVQPINGRRNKEMVILFLFGSA